MASLDPLYVSLEDGPIVDDLRRSDCEVVVLEGKDPRAVSRNSGWYQTGRAGLQLARLGNRLAAFNIGLFVPQSLKSGAVSAAARRRERAPLVWWIHDRMDAAYMGRTRALSARTFIRKSADGVIVNSCNSFEALGSPRLPTLLMPPGVDGLAGRGSGREPLSSDDPVTVAMVGRLSPWKGQRVLVDALATLPVGVVGRCEIYGAALFGEHSYADDLRASVDALGLRNQVTFHGHVPDAPSRLRHVDVLVHASVLPEPFGTVIIEGLAAGCVVVAADAGGPAEVITHGVDGLLYEPGNVEALARTLEQVRRMPTAERLAMAERGRKTADRYTTDRLAPRLVNWLEMWRRGERPERWTDGVSESPTG